MVAVVDSENGQRGLKLNAYRSGGKTGTAQRADTTCRCYKGYVTSYAAFAPVDDPQILTYVVVSNPRAGNTGTGTAAPVVRDLMSVVLPRYSRPAGRRRPTTPSPPSGSEPDGRRPLRVEHSLTSRSCARRIPAVRPAAAEPSRGRPGRPVPGRRSGAGARHHPGLAAGRPRRPVRRPAGASSPRRRVHPGRGGGRRGRGADRPGGRAAGRRDGGAGRRGRRPAAGHGGGGRRDLRPARPRR